MDRILIVEDDRFFREMFADFLKEEGYGVDVAASGTDALKMLSEESYGLVVTDLVLPDISGMEILSMVREGNPSIDVIMVTGNANLESAVFALKHGARDYMIKPVNPDEFRHSVAQCMNQRRLLDENEELKNMLALFQTCQAIAGCLDLERVHHLLVDAIVRELGLSRGVGIFMGKEGFELKEVKGLPYPEAKVFFEYLKTLLPDLIAECGGIKKNDESFFEPLADFTGRNKIHSAYMVCVKRKEQPLGVVVAFNEPASLLPEIALGKKNILFLLEQANRAFDNAETYNTAKDMLFIDDLSGLFNYRYLEVALERELKRAERYASHLAVLFLDIDSFKKVNDKYGHLVGSSVIREMGTLLKKSVREVDVVIRYGGDEYTVILVETTCQTASIVAERIRSQVESYIFSHEDGLDIKLTCSVGYACCPEDTMSKTDLLSMADKAMYAGKNSGKNCVNRFRNDANLG